MLRYIALTVFMSLALLMPATAAEPAAASKDDGFTPLFNGKDLTGWRNPYTFGKVWVEDGAICLQADKKFFLVTEKTYSDFILEAQIMLPPQGKSNSGIMLRCHVENAGTDKAKVFGYQAECDPTDRGWSGGLYDEGRRLWLNPKKGDTVKLVQAPLGQWIDYRLECVGDHLQFFVNGVKTTDFHDSVDASGYLGIQHHGEKGQIYRFRNIRIKEIKAN
jgi:hypothetical protein